MKKYLLRRILFSLFSLLVVIWTVMLLVFSLTDRSVIFQNDDTWNKRSANERIVYEYSQYQRYGYLEYVNYTSYAGSKLGNGDAYTEESNLIQRQEGDAYLESATVQQFIEEYTAKGYKIVRLDPIKFSSGRTKGQLKPGGRGFLLAVRERPIIYRLFDYLGNLFTVETTNDVKDPSLTDRYVRFEKDPYSGLFAIVGSGTTHPVESENQVKIDAERVAYWIGVGAKPSDTVKMLLAKQGIPTTAKAPVKD